jgi:hypothetical protein
MSNASKVKKPSNILVLEFVGLGILQLLSSCKLLNSFLTNSPFDG